MKITIERGEATTTVHVEGSGHYSCLNEQIDDPWLTTGRALNRMSDCGEGEMSEAAMIRMAARPTGPSAAIAKYPIW